MQSYHDFLTQSVDFPTNGFQVLDDELHFHGINLMELVETYGTPLRFTYLPLISKKIKEANLLFQQAMLKHDYRGSYTYCYCTKSSHFKHVLTETLSAGAQIETSSALDIPIIESLERSGHLSKDILVICNGFKNYQYKQNIVDLIHDGFTNVIPILDNKEEFNFYYNELDVPCNLGLRVATEEMPDFQFYTSRLGIREDEIIDFYLHKIKDAEADGFRVKLLHFFVHSGIQDAPYFWNEFEKVVHLYCKLKKVNPHLSMLDIGGGLPFKNSLVFEYDYEYMINELVRQVKVICSEHEVKEPDLLSEFGSYTVSESSGTIFKVLGRKQQNDREKWWMINGSIITMLPDIWAINKRFVLLPINNWDADYEKVNIGGMTCDSDDYYNQEAHVDSIFMPKTRRQQYLGFFHTGAYQEVLSGVGGIHHCLMPDPKHVIISLNNDNTRSYRVLHEEQTSQQVLKILGYRD